MKRYKIKNLAVMDLFIVLLCIMFFLAGCTAKPAMKGHQAKIGAVMGKEYHIPKRPVDRHFIGHAWSKQFGPIDNPLADEILVKKERSLDSIKQNFAINAGIGLGGQTIAGPMGEVGVEGGSAKRTKLEGVEIISPISLADIPFEPKVPYVTEALRLKNFKLKTDKSGKAGVNVSAGTLAGTGSASAQIGTGSQTGTEGTGLVVAYKLHMIHPKSYKAVESGSRPLPLNKAIEFPESKLVVNATLKKIEPGAKKSLTRNILWACELAEAKSRNIIAAWIVNIKSLDPRRKSLSIGFSGYPHFEDCQNYSGVIFSRIDPVTDKIHRQKINITVIDAELSGSLETTQWDARISFVEESFNIKLVSAKGKWK